MLIFQIFLAMDADVLSRRSEYNVTWFNDTTSVHWRQTSVYLDTKESKYKILNHIKKNQKKPIE